MTFISIIIASAGMSLGFVGLGAVDDGAKACCATAEAEPSCAMCEKMEDGKKCSMCEAKAGAKDTMADHAACATCDALGEGKMCASCAAHADMGGKVGVDDQGRIVITYKATPKIDSALYGNAAWPTHNTGDSLYAKDFQGQALPVALGNETWISKKTSTEGKVVILDFWATWCPPCRSAMPILDQLQKDNKENLAVLAIGGQREDEATVRSFVAEHKESISNLFDADQSVYSKFESRGIPLVVVMSTDGVIRWIGNPHDANFKKAVAQVLKVDPLINAKG